VGIINQWTGSNGTFYDLLIDLRCDHNRQSVTAYMGNYKRNTRKEVNRLH